MEQAPKSARKKRESICICCVCGNARDDVAGDGSWQSQETYLSKYDFDRSNFFMTHTFCPRCFLNYRDSIRVESAGKRAGE